MYRRVWGQLLSMHVPWIFSIHANAQLSTFHELEICVESLPECLEHLGIGNADEERVAMQVLQSWVQQASAQNTDDFDAVQVRRRHALQVLLALSNSTVHKPSLALGVGQTLHSYFWWGIPEIGQPSQGPDVEVISATLELHELAVRHKRCDDSETPLNHFLQWKCPWRWRFVMLLGAELGLHLASGLQDFAGAASVLERASKSFAHLKSLPYFTHLEGSLGPMELNQNWDYFPESTHWRVWPREVWPPFANFLEQNFATFREALDGLLASEADENRFGVAAKFQDGLTPRFSDWSRIKLIHSGGRADLCELSFMRKTCDLLGSRPEIGPRCGTYLSGASFARLLPGGALKPHFGTHPRLTAHLGLRIPNGASMTVGGEEVIWKEGRAVVFDDTYYHKVQHKGDEERYVLVAWFCHPCDLGWRRSLDKMWQDTNPLPSLCGKGGGGYLDPPFPGYGESV